MDIIGIVFDFVLLMIMLFYNLFDIVMLFGVFVKLIKQVLFFYGCNIIGGMMFGLFSVGNNCDSLKVVEGSQNEYGVKILFFEGCLIVLFVYFDIVQKNYLVLNSDYYVFIL